MTDYILSIQLHNGNPGDPRKPPHSVRKSTHHTFCQVILRRITRNNNSRIDTHARQKHLHLRNRRILPLIQNDEGVIERPTSHEGQWSNLDDIIASRETLIRCIQKVCDVAGIVFADQNRQSVAELWNQWKVTTLPESEFASFKTKIGYCDT